MIVTNEYIFLNPERNEINDIIDNTILKHNKKYGDYYCREIKIRYNIKFFDKIKNKTKNITTKRGINRTIVASQGRYECILR